jgi:aryl-alcohol dehydrogenase-like predicted oxidoreductase
VPELRSLRDAGKVRFLGVTEAFVPDPGHLTMAKLLADDWADVLMVGFNLLNQSARGRVLLRTQERDVAVLVMFAVRNALSSPEAVRALLDDLVAEGELDEPGDPVALLVREGVAGSLTEAAYRFCRHEPGTHVVLTGTGSAEHLEQNVRAIQSGPLRADVVAELARLYGHLDTVNAN